MSLKKKPVRNASIALSVVHFLLSKGELGRALRTVGIAAIIADPKARYSIFLEGHKPPITFAIKFEAKNDRLDAVLIGIKPSDMPSGLVPRQSGAWLLFEPVKGDSGEWGADTLAIDPSFPVEGELGERDWKFYAELALELTKKR